MSVHWQSQCLLPAHLSFITVILWWNASCSQHTWSVYIFREFYSKYTVMGKRDFYISFFGDNINCNTFLIPSFTFFQCWCHLFAGIRRGSWGSVHCCLMLQVQNLTKVDCWHTIATDGCLLHLINRNNNSDRGVFIITLLSSFILMHRHVCHTVLSSVKESYEQFHRHSKT